MGNEEDRKELKIGTLIAHKEREDLITLLRDYIDISIGSYKDMTRWDTDIAAHREITTNTL